MILLIKFRSLIVVATRKDTPTVLVVDDSLDTVRMINDTLEQHGMTVLVALDGPQALNITQNITPDIILLDGLMPNMDGFETCHQLKRNPLLVDVPIIFMTGLSDTEHVVMGLNLGAVDYVTKPINTEELIARMQVHLANARMAKSAYIAMDQTGQYLFAINNEGYILWATPQVLKRLKMVGIIPTEETNKFQIKISNWLAHSPKAGHYLYLNNENTGSRIEFLASISDHEHLLRLVATNCNKDDTERLEETFGLTGREADVLLWIANGKTNREIGLILNMSPRTVNKHLEQVFRKIGVENRTSAAASAIRCMIKN